VTLFCYNSPCVPLGYTPVLQYTLLFCIVLYSNGRVLKLYDISASVLSFSCQNCCSSKSFNHFWNTRPLVQGSQTHDPRTAYGPRGRFVRPGAAWCGPRSCTKAHDAFVRPAMRCPRCSWAAHDAPCGPRGRFVQPAMQIINIYVASALKKHAAK